MSTGILLRSIPLSRTTREAWRSNGIHIVKRSRDDNRDVRATVKRLGSRFIINYGSLSHDWTGYPIPVFNTSNSIHAISHPVALRRTLNDYIPENTVRGPHWHKRGGYSSSGVKWHKGFGQNCNNFSGDIQRHIAGTEYRVLTVGDVIVQASRKKREHEFTGNNFSWYWVGIDGIRNSGIIPLIKQASELIPDWAYTVFGWDIIVDNNTSQVYVLEINTSPGVNDASARRIVQQIQRII